MVAAICQADPGTFCGDATDMIVIKDVCDNWDKLPADVREKTSLQSLCKADLVKMCTEAGLKEKICANGKNLSPNFCKLHSTECNGMSTEEAAIHSDIYSWLVK